MAHLSSGSQFFGIQFLQDFESSGSGFFRIRSLQDPVSSGFCANTFFRKTFVSSMFLNILRGRHLWLNTSSGTILLCILNKHISPLTVLSSNSKTSRGGHLMHLQEHFNLVKLRLIIKQKK